MSAITVRHVAGDRFTVSARDHQLTVDQPIADGGEDSAPTPTELFIAGLASCVAHYAHRYLVRHGLPTGGLAVTATYELASRPARVADVHIDLAVPDGLPMERRDALLAVASHCTVHNSLAIPPEVTIALDGAPPVAA